MFQLYLLTVLTNVLAGLALASSWISERYQYFASLSEFMKNSVYRVVLGIVSMIVGIVNLFPSYTGDILIIGELLPSLSGMVAGLLLILESVSSGKGGSPRKVTDIADRVEKVAAPYITIVGITTVIFGLLHAILPKLALL